MLGRGGRAARVGQNGAVTNPELLDRLRFDDRGLVPVIVQEATSREVLMLAWMDAEAIRRSLETRRATYWSRSRGEYWVKGATSGHSQAVQAMRADCDGDTLLLEVIQDGPACHTGARTCFDVDGTDG